jgi:hypothetical protein
MRPVRHPEQNVIARGEEEDKRGHNIRKVPSTIKDVGHNITPRIRVPCVWLPRLVVDHGQYNVKNDEHHDVEALADGRSIPKR